MYQYITTSDGYDPTRQEIAGLGYPSIGIAQTTPLGVRSSQHQENPGAQEKDFHQGAAPQECRNKAKRAIGKQNAFSRCQCPVRTQFLSSSIALGRHARELLLGVREGESVFSQNELYGLLLKVERWLGRTIVPFFSCFVL
jgi:hypothetical protein